MWIALRRTLTKPTLWPTLPTYTHRVTSARTYASKKNKQKQVVSSEPADSLVHKTSRSHSTAKLIPASQRILTDEVAQAEYDKASSKMSAAVDWLRKEVAGFEARGVGRVTPAILDPVRVSLPNAGTEVRLQDVATVGVREGTNLVVTLFQEDDLKHVEKSIYAAKLYNVVPQKVDARTIKISIPRPTMEARTAFFNMASQTAEETRVQIRKTRDASVRKHKWKPRSDEIEQFQKLCDMRIKEVDHILARAKQELVS